MNKKDLQISKDSAKLDIINVEGRTEPRYAINKVKQFDLKKQPGKKGLETFRNGLANANLVNRVNAIIKINRYDKRLKANKHTYLAKKYDKSFNNLATMKGKYVRNKDGVNFGPVRHANIHRLVETTRAQHHLPHAMRDTRQNKQRQIDNEDYYHITMFKPVKRVGGKVVKRIKFRANVGRKPKALIRKEKQQRQQPSRQ